MDDGAPPHNSREMTSLLRAHFGNEFVISRDFPTACPPRSPNISPCNFWLWEFLKNHVNRGNIQTSPGLKESITRKHESTSSIDRGPFRATAEHSITRFEHVINLNGMHIEQICD